MRNPIPFEERDSVWHRRLDLLRGRYPHFCFLGGTGGGLPLFSFRGVSRSQLETSLVYLLENGYRTLDFAEMEAVLSGRTPTPERGVVLSFDQCRASLWTVVAPLLRRYNFHAVAYAIPGRIPDLPVCRPVWGQPGHDPDIDHSGHPFCSWAELRVLSDEGRISVQSNGWSHGKIFSAETFLRLIEPETRLPSLSWPMVSDPGEPLRFLSPSNVFHPLLPLRSRLSDALRHEVDLSVVARIHDDPDAAPYIFRQHFTQIETPADREDAIRRELMDSREEIGLRLGKEVRQFCFPWGVRGRVAAGLLADCGYTSAVVDRQGGIRLLRPGQPPFRIARLPSVYIRCLPGKGRKRIWRIRTEG